LNATVFVTAGGLETTQLMKTNLKAMAEAEEPMKEQMEKMRKLLLQGEIIIY